MAMLIYLAFQMISGLMGVVMLVWLQVMICLAMLPHASSMAVTYFLSCYEFIKKHSKYLVYRSLVIIPLFSGSSISTIGLTKSSLSLRVYFKNTQKSKALTFPSYLISTALNTIYLLIIKTSVALINARVAKLIAQKSQASSFLYLSMFYLTAVRLYQRILSLMLNEQLFYSPKISTYEYFCFIYYKYFYYSLSLVLRANMSRLYSQVDFQQGIERLVVFGC